MIDTHAHLDDEKFNKDQDAVIGRALASGVQKIINIGADLGSSLRSVSLAQSNSNIFAAVGLHPHIFNKVEEFPISNFQCSNDKILKTLNELKNLAQNKKVVAIGEIGLDYFSHSENPITEEQKENQKKGFVLQIELAQRLQLPAIVHCRGSKENPTDAYDDIYEILTNFRNGLPCNERSEFYAVFHCYGGDLSFTEKLLALENINFSFTGNITYAKPNSEILEVVRKIPLEKIMLETDCPYLTPAPYRGQRNEPQFISFVAEKVAEIKNILIEEVSDITTKNAKNFFKLS